jgi:hypothetical protein
LTTFFVGEGITDAQHYLEKCSTKYDKAISNVAVVHLLVEVGTLLKGKISLLPNGLKIRKGCVGQNLT